MRSGTGIPASGNCLGKAPIRRNTRSHFAYRPRDNGHAKLGEFPARSRFL